MDKSKFTLSHTKNKNDGQEKYKINRSGMNQNYLLVFNFFFSLSLYSRKDKNDGQEKYKINRGQIVL